MKKVLIKLFGISYLFFFFEDPLISLITVWEFLLPSPVTAFLIAPVEVFGGIIYNVLVWIIIFFIKFPLTLHHPCYQYPPQTIKNYDQSIIIKDHRRYTHFLSPMLKMVKMSPIQAPILSSICAYYRENLVKPSFSVPVENKPYIHPVCQNTADLHLTYWLVRPFKSSCF